MIKILNKKITILIIFILLALPAAAMAVPGELNAISITADILVIRPVGIALVPVTAVVFALSYPFTLIGKNTEKVFDALVVENIRYTFQRPLGQDVPIS